MNEEVKRVLKMIEEGKIKVEEGARLIEAIESTNSSAAWIDLNEPGPGEDEFEDVPEITSGKKPSWLFITVDDSGGGKKNVRIRIPIKLAKWALKFVPKSAQSEMKKEFGEDFDFRDLENLINELPTGVDLINVSDEEKGEHVRIFLR